MNMEGENWDPFTTPDFTKQKFCFIMLIVG